jgi:hypothetical protein
MLINSKLPAAFFILLAWVIMLPQPTLAQESIVERFSGTWLINEELSEDPDEAIEQAIKDAGGRVRKKWFGKKEKERYRGGPEDQEMYDRITYDDVLRISNDKAEFWFGYEDGFQRVFHTDGRTRSVGASELYAEGAQDFSFGEWDGETLLVEGRPRDGGYSIETYSLMDDGARLKAEFVINPKNFGAIIKLTRIYDRQ